MTNDEVKIVTGQLDRALTYQVVSLKEHLEKQLDDTRNYFEARLEALAKATELQADVTKSSFSSVNEFRSALNDYTKALPTRTEVGLQVARLEEANIKMKTEIDELKKYQNQMVGKASQTSVTWAYLFSAAGFMIGLISLLAKFVK